jgi:AsmA family protein
MEQPPNPQVRRLRRWGLSGLGLLLLLAAALLFVQQHLEAVLVHAFADRTGREIRINGPFEAHLFARRPTLRAQQVVIGNPPWMAPGTTAEIGRINVELHWQWSWPPLGIERLELQQAHLHLLRDADGHANWHRRADGAGNGAPLLHSLLVPQAQVDLDDERRHLKFAGTVTAVDRSDGGTPAPLRITGDGTLNGRDASFVVDGDPLARVERDRPYHFTLEERSGADRLRARGFIERPFDFHVLEGSFQATGPDMQDVYYLVGLKLVPTGDYRITGKLLRHDKRFEYRDLVGVTGSSDVGGTLTVDSSSGHPQVTGELRSALLRMQDLGHRAAAEASSSTPTEKRGLSDAPLRLAPLRRTEWSVSLKAETLEVGNASLHAVRAQLSIGHGLLEVEHLRATLSSGRIAGDARLDASHDVPAAELALRIADVPIEDLDHKADKPPPLTGALSGRIQLSGNGDSLQRLMGAAHGTVSAVLPNGAVRSMLAEGASLDLGAALAALTKSDKQMAVRCAVADFEARDGVLTARTLLLDTDKELITGEGTVHLDSGAIDLTLRGRPKQPRLTLHSALTIRGTPPHLEYRVAAPGVLAQTGAAVALGAVLTPIAAVLAFVNPGLAHDAECATLLTQAQAPGPGGPPKH